MSSITVITHSGAIYNNCIRNLSICKDNFFEFYTLLIDSFSNDVIELHGFEDDAEFRDSPSDISDKTGKMDSSTNSGVVTGHSNRNQNYNRPHRNYNHFGMNSNYRSQPQYHHPLQQSSKLLTFNLFTI